MIAELIIYIIIAFFIVAFIFYLYKYYNGKRVKFQIEELQRDLHTATNHTLVDKTQIPTSFQGNEYAISYWIYIKDYNYRYNNKKCIMYRGDRENTHSNPDIYLTPLNNSMVIRFEMQNETIRDGMTNVPNLVPLNNQPKKGSIASSAMDPKLQWDKIRYIKITQDNRDSSRKEADKVLSLAQVQVFDLNGQNVALGKPSSQSSINENMLPAIAVNGKTSGSNFTMTKATDLNWFETDLSSSIDVSKVIIYNRSDCCSSRLDGVHITLMNADRDVVYDTNYGSHTSEVVEEDRRYKVFQIDDFNKTDLSTLASTGDQETDDLGLETFQNFFGFKQHQSDPFSNVSGNNVSFSESFEEDLSPNTTPDGVSPEEPDEMAVNDLDTRLDKVELQLQKMTAKSEEPGENEVVQEIANDEKDQVTYDECQVDDIPLQKWTHIVVSLFNNNADVYIDGKLRKSCFLKGYPKPNLSDLHITANGGFNGFLSNIKYANLAMKQSDAYGLYQEGPKYDPTLWDKTKSAVKSVGSIFTPN